MSPSSTDPLFPRRFFDKCHDQNVIFGRGKGSYNNPGNKQLQHILRQNYEEYDMSDLQTRNVISHKVIDEMHNKRALFLKFDKHSNRWYELARDEVVKKIKQDFANLKAQKRNIDEVDIPHAANAPESRKRRAKEEVATTGMLLEMLNNDGSEQKVQSDMSAIMAVINHVFAHNHTSLDYEAKADLILKDGAVKESIISILERKSEQFAAMRNRSVLKGNDAARNPTNGTGTLAPSIALPQRKPATAPFSTETSAMPIVASSIPEKVPDDDAANTTAKGANESIQISRKLRVKDDRTYRGSVLKSTPHGVGYMKFEDGRLYCGGWRNGKLHGDACVFYRNGDKFQGKYVKNKRMGEGICYYNDGAIYQGHFRNDRLDGKGTYTTTDGGVYKGEFVNGSFEGDGVYKSPDGMEQRGYFSNWNFISPSTMKKEGDDDDDDEAYVTSPTLLEDCKTANPNKVDSDAIVLPNNNNDLSTDNGSTAAPNDETKDVSQDGNAQDSLNQNKAAAAEKDEAKRQNGAQVPAGDKNEEHMLVKEEAPAKTGQNGEIPSHQHGGINAPKAVTLDSAVEMEVERNDSSGEGESGYTTL